MIITSLLNVILIVLESLFNLIPALPTLPEEVTYYWSEFLVIVSNGMSIIATYTNMTVVCSCLVLCIAMYNFEMVYDFIMWFLRKVPFINIK